MREHGNFEMYIKGQTIVVDAMGAWNLETALRWSDEYQKNVHLLADKPWACLVNLTQFELLVPEAWAHIKRYSQWSNEQNQQYEAVVCGASYQQALVELIHEAMPNVDTQIFLNLDDAKSWLTQKGMFYEQ
ncbi:MULTISPECIES: hypothetical protein [Pseudoalteromonas]|uniref:STAS/SEC14 domain-containing protein n=1 Tax=Pseudoalteromonas obscura TaxID=3048491 RepID=A0ABT7ENM0_9GAMM|nr:MULTISPECIES: hypothetical protein [Pseudoalteromonas]MBQ4835225.1 hypothetical protein [Pseudoalteromonas luteoviolacea]MDK2596623.1 hypothetical protein [Pseudoalteromonas sp. P94(2023)]